MPRWHHVFMLRFCLHTRGVTKGSWCCGLEAFFTGFVCFSGIKPNFYVRQWRLDRGPDWPHLDFFRASKDIKTGRWSLPSSLPLLRWLYCWSARDHLWATSLNYLGFIIRITRPRFKILRFKVLEELRRRMHGSARAVAGAHDVFTTTVWDTVGVLFSS